MEKSKIEVTLRSPSSANNTQGRKESWIPAVVYGPKQVSTSVFVSSRFFVFNGTKEDNTLYTLDGGENLNGMQVMIKNVQKSPVKNQILHVDFYAPDMTKKVRVEVELDFQGTPKGMAEGGLIQTIRRVIEIECLPTEIPGSIPVDISHMEIGDTLKMGEVNVSEDFKVMSAPEWAIVSVTEASKEETPAEAAAGATPEGAAGGEAGQEQPKS